MILFSVGGLFALFEGIEKVRHPHETENLVVAIAILGFAIVLESISLRTAYREAQHHRDPAVSWWTWLRRSKHPELPVVLLEDIGAEIGLFFALSGVLIAEATDDPRWDAVGSIAIGILLIVIAVVLAVEMKGLLIGESASEQDLAAIESALTGAEGVNGLIHLRTQHLGPDELLVAAKLDFDPTLSVRALADAIDAAEESLRAAVPIARVVYIEPDIARTASTPVGD